MPKVGRLRHLLVVVDHFSGWVEAFFPLSTTTAGSVTKIILEKIIPKFGLVENIASDNGDDFIF